MRTFVRGEKSFELSNHLGNVLATITDKKIQHDGGSGTVDYYTTDVATAQDYYPFGMLMPGRTYNGANYRYGFNNKEKDDGDGVVQYDYGFRIYDPRLGRFKSVDPLTYSYPYYTPYQFAGNMPIAAIDLDGLEQYVVTYYKDQHKNTTKIEIRAYFLNDGTIQDQKVHKMAYQSDNKGGERAVPVGDKIAKGNVLVFEVQNEGTKRENIKVVDERNTPESALTKQEIGIFNKYQKPEKEQGQEQYLAYPDDGNDNFYQSNTLINSETKTYTATWRKPPPAQFKLNASFRSNTTILQNEKQVMHQLENTVQYLKENPNKTLTITGNTGCSDPNMNCNTSTIVINGASMPSSEGMMRRAQAVKDLLIKMGVNPNQLKAVQGTMIYTPPSSKSVPVDFKLENKKQ